MINSTIAIEETKNWIRDVVVGCNFCPFAGRELKLDTIHYIVEASASIEEVLVNFMLACKQLDDDDTIETTLIILTGGFGQFEDYLDLTDMCDELIESENYAGVYQVASFHPEYQFADSNPDDPANYTNRSIYPMLQLLREESIEKALEHFKNPDDIPANNIRFARSKGLAAMEALRRACRIPESHL